ncbi:MAG: hypothetical protein Q8Q69_08505 [Nitrosopumilaceae archaeon]|nr:hypothetical protein [Nitrosopumilaceae archaeon]
MPILESLAVGYLIGKASVFLYNTLFTPEERKQIQNKVKSHHFEYGVVATAAGVLTKSPTTVGTGLSWIADDWKDKDVAVQNMKNKVNSALDIVQKSLQNSNHTSQFYVNPSFSL